MNIKTFRDGNKWIALLGSDLQSGTAGSGNTEQEALENLALNRSQLVGGLKAADELRARGFEVIGIQTGRWRIDDVVFDEDALIEFEKVTK